MIFFSDLESISDHAEGIFGSSEECAVLDLDGTGGKTFLRVLLHLGMHDYPPLVSGALKLLFRHFSQRQEVLHAIKQVQLLVSENDVNSYKQIKDDLDGLRLLVEKSELWVYKSKSVEEKVNPNSNKGSKSSMSKPTSGKKYIYFKEIGTWVLSNLDAEQHVSKESKSWIDFERMPLRLSDQFIIDPNLVIFLQLEHFHKH